MIDLLLWLGIAASFCVLGMGWFPCGCCNAPNCSAELCQSGTIPQTFKFVVSGITHSLAHCSGCPDLDGTYFVEWNDLADSLGPSADGICLWGYTATAQPCPNDRYFVAGSASVWMYRKDSGFSIPAGKYRLIATIRYTKFDSISHSIGAEDLTWYEDFDEPIDCTSLVNFELTNKCVTDHGFESSGDCPSVPNSDQACDNSGATCFLTAI